MTHTRRYTGVVEKEPEMAKVVMPPLRQPVGDTYARLRLRGRFWFAMERDETLRTRERERLFAACGGLSQEFTAEEEAMIEFFVRKTVGRPLPLATLFDIVASLPAAEMARTLEGATWADVERAWQQATAAQKEAARKGLWEELANAADPIPARGPATRAPAPDIRTYTPTETDRMGAPVVLIRNVTYNGVTYPAGTDATVFWIGPDKYNPTKKRVGIRIGGQKAYVTPDALQRKVKYVTAPFKVGDRVVVKGAPAYYGGTVVYLRQQRDTARIRRTGGRRGRNYGRAVVDGQIGDWLLKIDWDEETLKQCAARLTTPPTWLYAARWDVVKVAE
jgi:hypothetical protein